MSCGLEAGDFAEYRDRGVWHPAIVVDLLQELPERERAGQAYHTHGWQTAGIMPDGVVSVRVSYPDGKSALRMYRPVGDEEGCVRAVR